MDYKDNYVTSKYFDFQKRLTNKFFGTFGSRFDNHSLAGNEDSHRLTLAYLFDNKFTKKLKVPMEQVLDIHLYMKCFFLYISRL